MLIDLFDAIWNLKTKTITHSVKFNKMKHNKPDMPVFDLFIPQSSYGSEGWTMAKSNHFSDNSPRSRHFFSSYSHAETKPGP